MKRYAQVIRLKPESVMVYTEAHANVWPEVLGTTATTRSYGTTLFGYFEYVGDDLETDQARLSAMPRIQAWGELMAALQEPLPNRKLGEWWAGMEEVFHLD